MGFLDGHLDENDDNGSSFDASFLVTFLKQNPIPIVLISIGFVISIIGIISYKNSVSDSDNGVIVLSDQSEGEGAASEILIIDISGEVEKPGVYELSPGSRVEDAIKISGGITEYADNNWMDKFLNRASLLTDGQKIYIPSKDDNSQSNTSSASKNTLYQSDSLDNATELHELININTSSASELESLWGIGRVTAQNIIEQRPYSKVEELLEKKILKQNVYERNKDLMSVY